MEQKKNGGGTATLEPDVVEVTPGVGSLEQQTRGEIDTQIATAKRYPRSIKLFINEAMEMATLNEEVAESCFYALPRDGKTVEGPSARLAEIVASAWGHMRIEGRIVSEDDRFVTARGTAWDLQKNVAIAYESRRRITNKSNQKFKDDMIGVTSNAATSIALRNAIFKVVPSSFWRPIYEQCRKVAVGNAETLVDRRAKMLAYFQKMGVPEARVLAQLNVRGVEDITLDHMATLKGLATAIKEGDTTVDEAFAEQPDVVRPQRASQAAGSPAPASGGDQAAGPAPAATTPASAPAGGTSTPAASSAPPAPDIQEVRGMKITKVSYVTPKVGAAFYEIAAAGKIGARLFVTLDEQLSKEAESFEGTEHQVAIRWQWGLNAEKARVAVLVGLAIEDGAGLFN